MASQEKKEAVAMAGHIGQSILVAHLSRGTVMEKIRSSKEACKKAWGIENWTEIVVDKILT